MKAPPKATKAYDLELMEWTQRNLVPVNVPGNGGVSEGRTGRGGVLGAEADKPDGVEVTPGLPTTDAPVRPCNNLCTITVVTRYTLL